MTVQVQSQAIQLIIDVISFLIPLVVVIVFSGVLVNFFKKFLRGG